MAPSPPVSSGSSRIPPGTLLRRLAFRALAIALIPALVAGCALKAAHEHHFLWVLKGEHNQVYVMGSFHLLRPGDYPLAPQFDAAYRQAKALCMEINSDDMDDGALALKALSLADEVGAGYPAVRDKAKALGIDLEPLSGFRPWFVAITASVTQLMRLGFSPNEGVERHFLERARADHKPVCGFETADEQLELLAGLSASEQAQMLVQSIDELADVGSDMNEMLDAWKRGDQRDLRRTAFRQMERNPQLYRALMVDRNRRFKRGIERLLGEREDYLVIVGAGHLVGHDSVLAMLRRDGHHARQL
jgi:uncharacterized protein YbaP (TraB family)